MAVFRGRTAAWLHGLDLDPLNPIEVAIRGSSGVRSRPGLIARRSGSADFVTVRRLPATTIRRTLTDLCHDLPAVEALVAIDAALRLRLIDTSTLSIRLAGLAEPAESPMETRLRWLLLEAGLPRPQVQTDLHDAAGRFVGRADLYYPSAHLVIEYDGTNHRERLVEDNRRQNALLNAGFKLLRFTAADMHQRRTVITTEVRRALSQP